MKTIEQIIKQDPIFINEWSDCGKFEVICCFEDISITKEDFEVITSPILDNCLLDKKVEITLKKWEGRNILFASYGDANCYGNAWVLFEQGGELFEVNADHCSCFGLGGQWDPEKVELVELKNRLFEGTWGLDDLSENNFKSELMAFLGLIDGKNVETK